MALVEEKTKDGNLIRKDDNAKEESDIQTLQQISEKDDEHQPQMKSDSLEIVKDVSEKSDQIQESRINYPDTDREGDTLGPEKDIPLIPEKEKKSVPVEDNILDEIEKAVASDKKEKIKVYPEEKVDNIDKLLDSALKDFDKKKSTKKKKAKPAAKSPEDDLLEMFGKAGFPQNASLQDLNNQLLNLSLLGQQQQEAGPSATTTAGPSAARASSASFPGFLGSTAGSPGVGPEELQAAASLQEALLQLSKDSEKLQDLPTEEEMERMFSGMTTDNMEKDLGNLLPMMEGMMQSLLSKELLYPAMKDMSTQFPSWLEVNRDKISKQDHDKFTSQYHITCRICAEFEKEEATSEQEKKQAFDRILALMEEMQKLGHPPKDLVGDTSLPSLSGAIPGQEQCCIS